MDQAKRSPRQAPGFTLMELLTVVAIIAILAGALLPVLSRARGKAHQASCTSNLRQIYTAFQMYERDWQGAYPSWHNMWTSSTATVPQYGAEQLHNALNVYVNDSEVWYCKSAIHKHKAVVWCGVDQRYTGYLFPHVRWRHHLLRIPGTVPLTPDQVPLAGDATGIPGDRDTPGLDYHGGPHFDGSVILWADGRVKWQAGTYTWQAIYP